MTNAWNLTIDQHGTAWVRFDLPEEKVNKFTTTVIKQLDHLLDQLASDATAKAVVLLSGKPDSFIVGADIAELAAIGDRADALQKAEAGQNVFNKIASLKVPTVAVIHGACMGGGLEMALACDYRLATDDEKTSLALPEVKLGIIPGWGGTQRLPRLVGLSQSLGMILSGKAIPGKKAYRMGLVDGLVAAAFLEDQAGHFVGQILSPIGVTKVRQRRRKCQSVVMRWLDRCPPTRALIFRQAHKATRSKTNGHYPAPLGALSVIRDSFAGPLSDGLRTEAQVFSEMSHTTASRNLVWLFQASQRAKKNHLPAVHEPEKQIHRGGVVGAGVMGGGIAWALSQHGIQVRLKDIQWDAVAKGLSTAAGMFKAMVDRRKMTREQMNLAMHRIAGTTGYEGFAHVDMVIEAVVEDMSIKKAVLREIETKVRPDTLLATNTSSLPITEMASELEHPQRFVGLHFFNPVNRMPLVEVIPGRETSQGTVVSVVKLARRLGKTPIVVADKPGFLVNRVLLPYVNESIRMFEEGMNPKRIDHLIKRFGMPMGPLSLADEVGLDVGLKVARVLEDAYGRRMRIPSLLVEAVGSGSLLGKKAGAGFYVYSRGKKKPNPEAQKLVTASSGHNRTQDGVSDQQIVDRAILTMVNEAARCLEEGVVADAELLDMAMLFGAGFAPFRGGLLRWADQVGLHEIDQRLRDLADAFGERFRPAPLIERLAAERGYFYETPSQAELEMPS